MELLVSLTIVMILLNMGFTRYGKAMEQAGVDFAGSHLSMVWTAQRMFSIEKGTYATSVADLVTEKLLAASIAPGSGQDQRFLYAITSATATSFLATATRKSGDGVNWQGTLTIDESGTLTGFIEDLDQTVQLYPPAPF